jgi:cytochrome c-type biogenesis protein CcmH
MSAARGTWRRWRRTRPAVAISLAVAISALALAGPGGAAPRAGLTLTGMEQDFMCVICHEALDVSQSPEADQERSVISTLIARGETRAQIDRAMVAEYGSAVLAVPKARGFNIVFYVIPPVLVLAGLLALAVLLPRWRRRARAVAAEAKAAPPTLDTAEAKRLEEELARYDG